LLTEIIGGKGTAFGEKKKEAGLAFQPVALYHLVLRNCVKFLI